MEENTKRINDVYDYLLYKHIIKGQEDMATALKTSRPNITAMLNGKKNVSIETLRKISDAFPGIFTLNWLMTGQSPMFIDDPFKSETSGHSSAVIDQGSLVNSALAGRDKTIAALEKLVEEKDDHIATLKARIADLKKIIFLLRSDSPSIGYAADEMSK